MQRFLLQQNIARYQRLLREASDVGLQHTLQDLLLSAQRELAVLDSASSGVSLGLTPPSPLRNQPRRAEEIAGHLPADFESSPRPYLILDPGPGLHIIGMNDAYARSTMIDRARAAGLPLFEVFPDNPDDATADGVNNLYASLRTAAETGQPHAMPIQRYDVRDPSGHFVKRYWQPVNTPVFEPEGRLICLLHHVEDVTRDVLSSLPGAGQGDLTSEPRRSNS